MATGLTNNRDGYGWLSLSLHWLMLVLLAAAYATMEFKDAFPKGSRGARPWRSGITPWA